jgi:zona occludens toxin
MPINVYTGLMRSGKSYEVVSQVILEAVAQGRRVVTNVDGIDNDLIQTYVADSRKLDASSLGQVVHCTNEQVFKPDFFPFYDDKKSSVTDTFCQPGDLVCIDEAWRFWGTDSKLLKEHKSFFLEHGHFVHPESGVACDLVLMIQDMSTLHRFLRSVVAFSFRTHKKVSLGLANTYSVNMWEGSKMTKATMIGTWVRKYDKAVFPLYSSFKGGAEGKTVNVDKRQNVLASKKLWFLAGCVVVFGAMGAYGIKRFFSPPQARSVDGSKPGSGSASPGGDIANQSTHAKTSDVSEAWRVSGSLVVGDKAFVVLVGDGGRLRLEHPSAFQNAGTVKVGDVDGQRVTTWSGPQASNILPEVKK